MPLKVNRKIEYKLQRALNAVNTLVDPAHPRLSKDMHVHADALRVYIESWIQPELEQALAEIRGETRTEDWSR